MDKRIQSKCKFSDFWLLAWKLTKFLMLFLLLLILSSLCYFLFLMLLFKAHVSFPLNFASPFSVMTDNSSEIFWLKHHMFWTKRSHQCTVFQIFECSNESYHPIAPAIFETTSSGFFHVSWKITPLYFLIQTPYTLDKNSPSKWNFQTFERLGENSPNLSYHIWNRNSVLL